MHLQRRASAELQHFIFLLKLVSCCMSYFVQLFAMCHVFYFKNQLHSLFDRKQNGKNTLYSWWKSGIFSRVTSLLKRHGLWIRCYRVPTTNMNKMYLFTISGFYYVRKIFRSTFDTPSTQDVFGTSKDVQNKYFFERELLDVL